MTRNLIFDFDGTNNGPLDTYPTNIRIMHLNLSDNNQVAFYYPGPGEENEGTSIGELLGAAFGIGCREIVQRAVDAFVAVYMPGDRIYANAFSRGAVVSRLFAKAITDMDYEIELLCLFDTVEGVGLFGNLDISPKVKRVRHAVALHEDRKTFEPNLVNARDGVEEVWFRGNHADIGGGYEDAGLSNIVLDYMINQAELAGLKFVSMSERRKTPGMEPHRESGIWRREDRIIGVQVDGEWTGLAGREFAYS